MFGCFHCVAHLALSIHPFSMMLSMLMFVSVSVSAFTVHPALDLLFTSPIFLLDMLFLPCFMVGTCESCDGAFFSPFASFTCTFVEQVATGFGLKDLCAPTVHVSPTMFVCPHAQLPKPRIHQPFVNCYFWASGIFTLFSVFLFPSSYRMLLFMLLSSSNLHSNIRIIPCM